MKRIGGLFDQVVSVPNLAEAAWRAAQGKRDRAEVASFLGRLDAEIALLARELRDGTFCFGRYREFQVQDTKTRTIHAPPFRDRVVHHALIAVVGPVLERGATSRSFACRQGRGQHRALALARTWVRRDAWFLKLDVAKYYDSLPHRLVHERLARRFREPALLALFDILLASYHSRPGFGLPIGALTSQYLGNYYLDVVDHWALQRLRPQGYLRYMDDMLFFGDATTLRTVRDEAMALLLSLGLTVKQGGVLNRCSLGVPWLGFTLYPDRTRLNPPGRQRLRRKLKAVERECQIGRIGEATLQQRTEALFAHARLGDDIGWRRMVCTFSRCGEALELASGPSGRVVEQFGHELPRREAEQEPFREQEQEQRIPAGAGSRHGDNVSPDDAPSCAPSPVGGDKPTRKTLPRADIPRQKPKEKVRGGAAREGLR